MDFFKLIYDDSDAENLTSLYIVEERLLSLKSNTIFFVQKLTHQVSQLPSKIADLLSDVALKLYIFERSV